MRAACDLLPQSALSIASKHRPRSMNRVPVLVLYAAATASSTYAFQFINTNSWLPLDHIQYRIIGVVAAICQLYFILGQYSIVSEEVQTGFSLYCIGALGWSFTEVFEPEWALYTALCMLFASAYTYWSNCSWRYNDPPGVHASIGVFPTLFSWYVVIVHTCDTLPLHDNSLEYCAILSWCALPLILIVCFRDVTSGLFGAWMAQAIVTTNSSHKLTALAGCFFILMVSIVRWCRPIPDHQPLLA